MPNPYYIAISGVMGSGKTTLSEGLSSNFGWELAHPNKQSNNYLTDLFKDMQRWAFEAQVSFLTNKAFTITQLLEDNKNFILDRSLSEDALIFVNYFHSKDKIDDRGLATYNTLYERFNSTIRPPDLIIYCDCELEVIKDRVESRNRDFQKLYPENHLADIYSLYQDWIANYKSSPLYKVNTKTHDLRDKKTMRLLAEEVANLLNSQSNSQLQLFEEAPKIEKLTYLKPIVPIENFELIKSSPISLAIAKFKIPSFPFAYIAAPFTSNAIEIKNTESKNFLFNEQPIHGRISPKNAFRKMLTGIAKKLKRLNINALIPHRDVSNWGASFVPAQDVFELCTYHVSNCSLFIGVAAESSGTHYELGLAYALKKPIILIRCSEIANSYISNGITDSPHIKVLTCVKIKDIPGLVSSNECFEFLNKQNFYKS